MPKKSECQAAFCPSRTFIKDENKVSCKVCANSFHLSCLGLFLAPAEYVCESCKPDPRDAEIAELREKLRVANESVASKNAEILQLAKRLEISNEQVRKVIEKSRANQAESEARLLAKENEIANLKSRSNSAINPDQDVWDAYKKFMANEEPPKSGTGSSSGCGGTFGSFDTAGLSIYADNAGEKARSKYKCSTPLALGSDAAIFTLQGRKALRELPEFDGNPSRWPVFMHAFIDTTNAGNYSESENIPRLQKALKGKARDLVDEDLATTEVASKIMVDLESVFGNTDNVVVQLAHDLRKVKKCKSIADPNLIKLRSEVGRFNNTLVIMGREGDGNNSILLSEIEDKLGHFHFPTWTLNKNAIRLQFKREPNFRDLEHYLRHITKAIQVKTVEDLEAFGNSDNESVDDEQSIQYDSDYARERSTSESSESSHHQSPVDGEKVQPKKSSNWVEDESKHRQRGSTSLENHQEPNMHQPPNSGYLADNPWTR